MSSEKPRESGRHRRSLRFRLMALVVGTGIFPFVLALLLLVPVVRKEVAEAQGLTLARDAAFLASQVSVYRNGHRDERRARRVVDSFRRGRRGRAYLYDSAGGRLAGLPDLPALPSAKASPHSGWTIFELGRLSHFAGIAAVPSSPSRTGPPGGAWYVAIVQPESEVMAPLWDAVSRAGLLFGGIAAFGLYFSWRLGAVFFVPLRKLRQSAEIVSRINLGHRIDIRTGDEFEVIAHEFNRMADSLQSSYGVLEEQVREATSHLSDERNRLAAVLRTMSEGVVMANEAGLVVLMTPRARLILGAGPSSGVGVPLSDVLPADRLAFHLRRARRAWEEGRESSEVMLVPLADGPLIRGVLSVVPGPAGEPGGVLFVFRDLGAKADSGEALGEIPGLLKGPATTLRSLAEVLAARPDMVESKRRSFLAAMGEEVARLVDRLDAADLAAGATKSGRWPVLVADPRDLVAEAVGDQPGVRLSIEVPLEEVCLVVVEPYSWVRALSAVLSWVRSENQTAPVDVSLVLEEEAVVVAFRLQGVPLPDPTVLETEPVALDEEGDASLGEIVKRNRGEIWTRSDAGGGEVRLALLRSATVGEPVVGIADEQPEFYDFDLFLSHPSHEPSELLASPLAALEYVVFDTETTGLHPSDGDEVVSISAVRIRRGKIVAADTFHSLVDPCRHIPERSICFHGIDDTMVRGAPTLRQLLPQFEAYVGTSILVAHNAAFDMKFLTLGAEKYGLPLIGNPVIDTLLLSYGLHRDFVGHNLDAIAHRLGVEIKGRHTSLGDARATAEIFLGLVPLLSARGVITLADAKAFCNKMLLFRWQTSRY